MLISRRSSGELGSGDLDAGPDSDLDTDPGAGLGSDSDDFDTFDKPDKSDKSFSDDAGSGSGSGDPGSGGSSTAAASTAVNLSTDDGGICLVGPIAANRVSPVEKCWGGTSKMSYRQLCVPFPIRAETSVGRHGCAACEMATESMR
jgi:hypothetical protein